VFALLARGGVYVFFTPMRPMAKLAAVLSTFPFAVLINLLRIVLTAALSYHVSQAALGMLIHELTGTITFFIALTLFILLCEFLQRHFFKTTTVSAEKSAVVVLSDTMKEGQKPAPSRQSWLPMSLAMAFLIPSFYFATNVSGQRDMRLSADLKTVVAQVDGFQTDETKSAGNYKDSGAELDRSTDFVTADGHRIETYVGFRGRQHDDKRLHSPKLQFPYGWNYVWIEAAQVPTSGNPVTANWMLTQNNQLRVLVLYWYQVGDRTFGGELEKRINLIRDSVLHGRSDSAIIRLATPVGQSEHLEQAKRRLATLAAELSPRLNRTLPQ
jgi:EpsI family protein